MLLAALLTALLLTPLMISHLWFYIPNYSWYKRISLLALISCTFRSSGRQIGNYHFAFLFIPNFICESCSRICSQFMKWHLNFPLSVRRGQFFSDPPFRSFIILATCIFRRTNIFCFLRTCDPCSFLFWIFQSVYNSDCNNLGYLVVNFNSRFHHFLSLRRFSRFSLLRSSW